MKSQLKPGRQEAVLPALAGSGKPALFTPPASLCFSLISLSSDAALRLAASPQVLHKYAFCLHPPPPAFQINTA